MKGEKVKFRREQKRSLEFEFTELPVPSIVILYLDDLYTVTSHYYESPFDNCRTGLTSVCLTFSKNYV